MNILLINHYAGSPAHGMEFRPYYLAKAWQAMGHQVRIVASSVSHLRHKTPEFTGSTCIEDIDGVEYLWLRTRPYVGNGAARLLNMLQFTAKLRGMARSLAAGRPDVVIASSTYPYDIWPARRIARLARAKLVFEIHDIWPLTPRLLGGFSKWHPMIASMQIAENYAYRHADRVISLLPGAEAHARAHHMAEGKFAYIPNGFDPGAALTDVPAETRRQIENFASKFDACCIYAGGHAVSNALDPLLDAAAAPASARTGFVLVGKGSEKARLQEAARRRALTNVLFLDPVPKTAVNALLKLADMAYIGWHDSPLYEYGTSPNKLFDYMLAKLPIIHSTSAPYDLVREAACGISVPANDPAAIAQAARTMTEMPPAARQRMGNAGHEYVVAHHTYPVLAQRFIDAL